jgi:hypothetical protein
MARSSAPRTCPSCTAPLVEIRLGDELVLRSCSGCDSRWWLRSDEPTELGAVLDVVRTTDASRRPLRTVG